MFLMFATVNSGRFFFVQLELYAGMRSIVLAAAQRALAAALHTADCRQRTETDTVGQLTATGTRLRRHDHTNPRKRLHTQFNHNQQQRVFESNK